MESLERILGEHPFLAGLAPEHLAILTGCVANVRFAPGDYLLREGQAVGKIFLIRQGTVAIEAQDVRGPITLETVGPGDVLGLSWLTRSTQHFDCHAREAVTAFAIDQECLRAKMDADTALGYALASRLLALTYERLTRLRLQRLDIYK